MENRSGLYIIINKINNNFYSEKFNFKEDDINI